MPTVMVTSIQWGAYHSAAFQLTAMMHVLIVYLLSSHISFSPISYNTLLHGQCLDFFRPQKEKKIYSYVIIFNIIRLSFFKPEYKQDCRTPKIQGER